MPARATADAFVAKYAQPNFTIAASAFGTPSSVNPGASATSTITVGALERLQQLRGAHVRGLAHNRHSPDLRPSALRP
jgi:hypothetical protein